MNVLDCVKLVKPFKDLKIGTKGCVVTKHSETDYDVEFIDDSGDTIDVYTISKDFLEVYWTPKSL